MKSEDLYVLFSRGVRRRKCVLSVYLDVDQSNPGNLNRGFEKQYKKMASALRKSLRTDREQQEMVGALHRVSEFLTDYSPVGKTLTIFVDESDGFFWARSFAFAVPTRISWDRELLLQPLTQAFDELEEFGIVLVDKTRVRLFVVQLGEIEELLDQKISRQRVRHVKTTGSDQAEYSSRMQRKADNQVRSNLRVVTTHLEKLVKARGIHRIVLAGTSETTSELQGLIPARLGLSAIAHKPLDIDTRTSDVLASVLPLVEAYERNTELGRVNDVVTAALKGEGAVIGLEETLRAINSGRAWEVVYSSSFDSAGYECPECFALFIAKASPCPYCRGRVAPAPNLVGRAIEHTLRKKGRVEVVKGEAATALERSGGIGAFLKRPTRVVSNQ